MRRWTRLPLALLPLLAGCAAGPSALPWMAEGRQGMVAADSRYASNAGLEVLEAGGNAFDAAVAVSFALAVTRPQSTGLGGGGFAIARLAGTGEIVAWDFRETAPAASSADMYAIAASHSPDGPPPERYGHLAAGTPGLLAGRVEMLERYGTRPLADTLKPAIRLARDGFEVDRHYVEACETAARRYDRWPELKERCEYVYRVHLRNGDLPEVGDLLLQPQLARLLEAIAAGGADVFYRGEVAAAIEHEMQAHGGIISPRDLADYRVVRRSPIVGDYRGQEVISMPPPSSGGVCLIEALNILETVDAQDLRESPLAEHYRIEAMKHAFADRSRWLADADFVPVPVDLLISKVYAAQLAEGLAAETTSDPDTYGSIAIPTDAGTSHFCVVDRWGNCVVSTETINTSFGSLAAVDEWGLILNNEMDDFSAQPGEANAFGLLQSQRNAVAPGKRPLSSMCPTIVMRDGAPMLLLGGSGGPRIISSVLNVMLNVIDLNQPLDRAMERIRPHHQWQPDRVFFDRRPPQKPAEQLRERGHRIDPEPRTGVVQAIVVRKDGMLVGASDPRKGGAPAGY